MTRAKIPKSAIPITFQKSNKPRIKITFPSDSEFKTNLENVKTLPGRQYHADAYPKYWTCPFSIEAIEALTHWGFKIDPKLKTTVEQIQALPMTLEISNTCFLINPPDSIKDFIKENCTLDNPQYIAAVKYGGSQPRMPKKLKFYAETPEGIAFMRGLSRDVIKKIKQASFKCKTKTKTYKSQKIDIQFNGVLRPYQKQAEKDYLKKDMGVIQAPTGSGKTVLGLSIISKRQQKTLILVHTKELLYQWEARVQAFMDYQPGMIGDGSCIIKPITIGMVQTVKNRMSKLKNKFGFIIVDECHRTPSTTFQKAITAFNSKYLLGLSATAWRNDGLDSLIHLALGPRAHKIENAELIENGSILRPEIKIRYTDFEYNFKGDYGEMLSTLTKDPKRNMQIIDDVRNNLNNGTNLIVSDRIYHLRLLQTLLNEPGSQMLIGETKTDERKEIIDKVNSGEIKTLFSTFQLLGEGFDCSGLTNLFIASPFKYSGRLVQIAGRVMRPAPGKTAKIYDYVDKKQPVLLIQSAKRKSAFEKIIGA